MFFKFYCFLVINSKMPKLNQKKDPFQVVKKLPEVFKGQKYINKISILPYASAEYFLKLKLLFFISFITNLKKKTKAPVKIVNPVKPVSVRISK